MKSALTAISAELDAIEERKAIIKAEADEKRAAMEEVLSGKGEPIEEKQEERKTMDNKEIRKSAENLDAWVDRKSTRLNSSHIPLSRMPSSA